MRPARALLIAALVLGLVAAPLEARPTGEVGARIVNGTTAPAGAWPSATFLTFTFDNVDRYACTGSLIAPRVILTAAHCVIDEAGDPAITAFSFARPGVTSISDNSTRQAWASATPHPGYDPTTLENDIALITLTNPAGAPAAPIPLIAPWQDALVVGGAPAAIAGWGMTHPSVTSSSSSTLQEATVPIIADTACADVYGGDFVASAMLCAGDLAQRIDTCKGDSGGPLAMTLGGSRVLVGDTSWGSFPCADGHRPGVFGRVSAFRNWILDDAGAASTLVRDHLATQTASTGSLALSSTGPSVTASWTVTPANWTTTGFRVAINGTDATVTTTSHTVSVPGGGPVTAVVDPLVTLGTAAGATITATPTPTRAPVVTARADSVPRVGAVVTASAASDDPWGGALTYEWRVGGAIVQQGAQATYRPTAAEAGKLVTIAVSAANAAGTGTAAVDAGRVTQSPQIKAGPVPVRGAARVGGRLQARPPAVAGYPKPRATYRWFRDGRLVRSARTSVYRVRPVDAGARITGKVTWANATGRVTRALSPVRIAG